MQASLSFTPPNWLTHPQPHQDNFELSTWLWCHGTIDRITLTPPSPGVSLTPLDFVEAYLALHPDVVGRIPAGKVAVYRFSQGYVRDPPDMTAAPTEEQRIKLDARLSAHDNYSYLKLVPMMPQSA